MALPEGEPVAGKAMSGDEVIGAGGVEVREVHLAGEPVMVWPLSRVQDSTASYANRMTGRTMLSLPTCVGASGAGLDWCGGAG
jgi:hypothetical protein